MYSLASRTRGYSLVPSNCSTYRTWKAGGRARLVVLLLVFLAGLLTRWASLTKSSPSTDDSTLQHGGLCTQSCTLYTYALYSSWFQNLLFSIILTLCSDPVDGCREINGVSFSPSTSQLQFLITCSVTGHYCKQSKNWTVMKAQGERLQLYKWLYERIRTGG